MICDSSVENIGVGENGVTKDVLNGMGMLSTADSMKKACFQTHSLTCAADDVHCTVFHTLHCENIVMKDVLNGMGIYQWLIR